MTGPPMPPPKRVLLGEITSAHGIRGEVQIRAYTSKPEGIADYGALEDEAGLRRFIVAPVRVTPKGLIAKVDGINERTSAEKLIGTKLYISRDRLPATADNEYYLADLIGLRAFDQNGKEVGMVIGLHNFGAGDIIEIRLMGSQSTDMLPFSHDVVPQIDLENGTLVVVKPGVVEVRDGP